jgi:hypothetical protein
MVLDTLRKWNLGHKLIKYCLHLQILRIPDLVDVKFCKIWVKNLPYKQEDRRRCSRRWEDRRLNYDTLLCRQPRIFHISRKIDGVAHRCAQHANQYSRSRPTRSCRNSTHRNTACPILDRSLASNKFCNNRMYNVSELKCNCGVLCILHRF